MYNVWFKTEYFVQTRVKTFYFVQVTDLIIKPNFVQSSSMSLKIMLCTRLSLDIVHIKVKSTRVKPTCEQAQK